MLFRSPQDVAVPTPLRPATRAVGRDALFSVATRQRLDRIRREFGKGRTRPGSKAHLALLAPERTPPIHRNHDPGNKSEVSRNRDHRLAHVLRCGESP